MIHYGCMTLYLYNTLTKTKRLFTRPKSKAISLYTCGPTVYNYAHIGNLRTYVFEDVLKRTLIANGYRVKHVMNITDVGHLTDDADNGEDKVERAAKQQHLSAWELSAFYTDAFQEDLRRLNILPPTQWSKATDYINEQVNLIKKLERRGHTYTLADGVYFDTSTFPRYGALARLNLKGLKAGARIEMVEGKRNPSDFALWKLSLGTRRQMEWPSPWGVGFPGWHIECSAMALKLLGMPLDIHCGGIDHINVHHTNEIAQSEAATGKRPFARWWMHGAFLTVRSGKMAKSEDNFLTLSTLIEQGYQPLSYRYLLYSGHYRTTLDFSIKSMDAAQTALTHLTNSITERGVLNTRGAKTLSIRAKRYESAFLKNINDDLNIPSALSTLWGCVRDTKLTNGELHTLIKRMDAVLGLELLQPTRAISSVPPEVEALMIEREQARKDKQWDRADQLRTLIDRAGFIVEDTPNGPRLKTK